MEIDSTCIDQTDKVVEMDALPEANVSVEDTLEVVSDEEDNIDPRIQVVKHLILTYVRLFVYSRLIALKQNDILNVKLYQATS